jgi:hypothetical protein
LAVAEEGAEFGFRGGGNDKFAYTGRHMDRTVELDRASIDGEVAEEENTANATTCLGFGEVGSIRVDIKDHVGGIVADGSFGVRVEIVEKLFDFVLRVFCCSRLLRGNATEGNEGGDVDRPCVV